MDLRAEVVECLLAKSNASSMWSGSTGTWSAANQLTMLSQTHILLNA